jgi:N-acetylmuramoyl-L-alanine amidase
VRAASTVHSRPAPAQSSESAFNRAVRLRTSLEASPPESRTSQRFEDVLNAFRAVYHEHPASAKAPAAAAAVADLLAEKGRVLGDQRALRSAIGQYEYVRQQYPGSPQVQNTLLLEGEICRQDLKDLPCAEEKFRAVLAEQPGSSFAEQAEIDLKEMTPPKTAAAKLVANKSSKNAMIAPAQPVLTAYPDIPPPPAPPAGPHRPVMITGMRHWSNLSSTRIAIDLGGQVEFEAARVPNPDRIFFDLHGARLGPGLNGHQVEVVDDGYLKRIRAAQFHPDVTRVVLDVTGVSEYSAFLLPNPWRLIIDVHSEARGGKSSAAPNASKAQAASAGDSTVADVARLSSEPAKIPATDGPTSAPVSSDVPAAGWVAPSSGALAHPADPTSDGQRSLVRALGLKVGRIVIDPGHGGHDTGTLGPGGITEKDVVLDVALRVGKLLQQRLGAEIVYTRDDDTFIPLETRTAMANKAQADLFLSIHANSSPEPAARGVETYYLNFTSDANALDVAARENALSSNSVHQLSDLVRKITLKDKIDESREFAADVDSGLYSGLKKGNPGLKDRGVKKAPFVVLIGAQMPSILAEISFLTNPSDARQLRQAGYRQRIAESLVAGVERYLHGLSGTRPTDKSPARRAARSSARASEEGAGQ